MLLSQLRRKTRNDRYPRMIEERNCRYCGVVITRKSVVDLKGEGPRGEFAQGWFMAFDDHWNTVKLPRNDGVFRMQWKEPCDECKMRLYAQIGELWHELFWTAATARFTLRLMLKCFFCEVMGGQRWEFGPKRERKHLLDSGDFKGWRGAIECAEKGHLFDGALININRHLEADFIDRDDDDAKDAYWGAVDDSETHTVYCSRCGYFMRELDKNECEQGWRRKSTLSSWVAFAIGSSALSVVPAMLSIMPELSDRQI